MGGKAPHFIPSNRPESGGSDKDGIRESSGLLDREKNEFAAAEQEKNATKHDHAHEKKAEREAGDEGLQEEEAR
jgi:hypothetical protein